MKKWFFSCTFLLSCIVMNGYAADPNMSNPNMNRSASQVDQNMNTQAGQARDTSRGGYKDGAYRDGYGNYNSRYYDNNMRYQDGNYGGGYYQGNAQDGCCPADCPADAPCNDCWCLYVHYKPCYYTTQRCVEEQIPCKKTCCRYVPQYYEVQRCRQVPEYYTETCCCQVPEYYEVDDCKTCQKMVCDQHCEYVPEYYWKHICGKEGCQTPCPQ